jgi:putative salt-induced outer membrane protein YdiY
MLTNSRARRRALSLLGISLVLFFASTARAGIYNVQSILATEADPGLSGAISGSADWRTGNVDYLFLTATPLARYRSGKHLIIGLAEVNHKTSGGSKIISRFFEHLRYRYQISDRVLGEVFAQHEFDAIKRLKLRALVGAGPKLEIVSNKSFGIDLGVSYMLEYESLQDDGPPDSGATDLQHRNSTYLVGRYELDERVQLVETLYVQPRLTGARDLRVLNESQVTFKVTKRLSFTTALSIAYDSRPPDTIKKLDTALKSSLTLEL